MGLKKSFRVFRNIGYIGRFVARSVKIGDVFQVDDNGLIRLGNVGKRISLTGHVEKSSKASLSYTRKSGVAVTLGGKTKNAALGQNEAELKFTRSRSAFVELIDCEIEELMVGEIRPQLIQYWQEHGYMRRKAKTILANKVLTAQSGVVIFSLDRHNRIVLEHKSEEPLKKLADIGSGNVEIIINTKEKLDIISSKPHQPMFGAVRFKGKHNKFELI